MWWSLPPGMGEGAGAELGRGASREGGWGQEGGESYPMGRNGLGGAEPRQKGAHGARCFGSSVHTCSGLACVDRSRSSPDVVECSPFECTGFILRHVLATRGENDSNSYKCSLSHSRPLKRWCLFPEQKAWGWSSSDKCDWCRGEHVACICPMRASSGLLECANWPGLERR